MNLKPMMLLAASAIALTALSAPVAFGAVNECQLTGATDASGDPVAPPCLDSRSENAAVQGLFGSACYSVSPACVRVYVLLVPDKDGDLATGVNFDPRLLWQESNGCSGLQRGFWSNCVGKDKLLIG